MTHWRKSSHSGTSQNTDCVELTDLGQGRVGLRDSKNPDVGYISIPVESFAALVDRVKRDELNL